MSLITCAAADMPVLPRGKGEQCVEPTELMRKNHMELLLHHRDATMYRGIRTSKHSLNNCVDCHVQENGEGQYIAINAEGQFCEVCHTYTSVKLDCFECHATAPDDKPIAASAAHTHSNSLTAHSFSAAPDSQ